MDRWQASESELNGYWNPPPPGTPTSPNTSVTSEATIIAAVSEESEREHYLKAELEEFHRQLQLGYQQNSFLCNTSTSSPCFGDIEDTFAMNQDQTPSVSTTETGPSRMKRKRLSNGESSVEVIEIDKSSEEEEDYDVCIRKQLSSSQKELQAQEQQKEPPPLPLPCPVKEHASDEDPEARAIRYQVKFSKLRHFYDKLKAENAELKQKSQKLAEELNKLSAKSVQQSLDVARLQGESQKKDDIMQLMQSRVKYLEKRLSTQHTTEGTVTSDIRKLTKRNEDMEAALKSTLVNQLTAFNSQKGLLEKTYLSYEQLFGRNVASAALNEVVAAAPKTRAEDAKKCDQPDVTQVANTSTIQPHFPSDPRLASRGNHHQASEFRFM